MPRPSPQTDRLLTLVDLLTARPHDGLTLSEIARRLGVTPATCHPMLASLTQAGWLMRHPTRRTYRLGPAIIAAGHSAAAGFPALDFAHPVMAEVQRDLGLAVLALMPSDGHATLVDLVRDPGVPGPAIRIGDQTPLHPPFGVPYVAWADDDEVERWLAHAPPNPEVRDHYRQVLKAARQRRFSVDLATAPEARVHAALTRLEPAQSRDYVTARLRAVGVHANPFEDQGLELLIQAAGGLPRAINHLAQRAIEAAAAAATPTISAIHVQAALDRLPWLGSSAA